MPKKLMVTISGTSSLTHDSELAEQIVCCPSCQTLFEVQGSFFAGGRKPRFHCTVCSSIFIPHAEEGSVTLTENSDETDGIPHYASAQGSSTSSETPSYRTNSKDIPEEPLTEDLAPYEVPRSLESTYQAERPFEEDKNEDDDETFSGRDIKSLGGRLLSVRDAKQTSLTKTNRLRGRLTAQKMSSKHQLRLPLLFCFCMVTTLAFLTSVLTLSSTIAGAIDPLLFSKGWSVPPVGVVIEDTIFKKIAMKDGKTATVIAGVVANRTRNSFQEVSVQGLSFDTTGALISSGIALTGSKLTEADTESLLPHQLETLANKKGAQLKPGERKKFIVALRDTNEIETDSSYYSARIYLVR
jgi:hypothetical protein